MTRKQRLAKIIEIFQQNNPIPKTELDYKNPYELIVAVILSAQCTDVRVNKITPDFFKTFPNAKTLAAATESAIYEKIRSCSYPNNKARNLKAMAEMLTGKYKGKLPTDPEEMQQLPGVGRKTAHVLASVLFQQNVIAVDTHVQRVSVRLGLAPGATTPLAVEKALVSIAPADVLHDLHHWLILHGRYVCKARKPLCGSCAIADFCSYPLREV
ncbi:MAG: endonuclease III [Bacteroidales bacterium]|jgi:endonuclease-3|nr:endonuclease III [Bacteroidales bacterium]HPB03152.1 endonuclease III [Bacteroidales bacterium]HPF00433.1 endonuclease III [Bacteroidales bacterium]